MLNCVLIGSRDVIPFDEDLQQDITENGENIEDLRLKVNKKDLILKVFFMYSAFFQYFSFI